MHVHIGFPEFVTFAAYLIIFGFLWRSLAAKLAANDNRLGKAMAYIY
jgi:hypothetical protein